MKSPKTLSGWKRAASAKEQGLFSDASSGRPIRPAQNDFPVPVLAEPSSKEDKTSPVGGEARESTPSPKTDSKIHSRGGETVPQNEKGGDVKCAAHVASRGQATRPVGRVAQSTLSLAASDRSVNVQAGNGATIPQLIPGVYEKIAPDIYHQQNSFSRGDMLLAGVPAKLYWHKNHPQAEKVTPAKMIGSAFHCRLLEPDVFDARYTISRYEEYRSTEAKDWRDEQTKLGRVIITADDLAMIDQMVQSCREHAHFSKVFSRAGMRRELTVIAKDPATGLLLRARYDIVPGGNVLPDIKSAMDASPEGFGKAAWNLGYGAQAAHYLYVWNLAHPDNQRHEFVFLVQEKEPPYLSNMFVTPYSLIEYWDRILRARRYVIAQCLTTGVWPGYEVLPLERSEFELPRYGVFEIEKAAENG